MAASDRFAVACRIPASSRFPAFLLERRPESLLPTDQVEEKAGVDGALHAELVNPVIGLVGAAHAADVGDGGYAQPHLHIGRMWKVAVIAADPRLNAARTTASGQTTKFLPDLQTCCIHFAIPDGNAGDRGPRRRRVADKGDRLPVDHADRVRFHHRSARQRAGRQDVIRRKKHEIIAANFRYPFVVGRNMSPVRLRAEWTERGGPPARYWWQTRACRRTTIVDDQDVDIHARLVRTLPTHFSRYIRNCRREREPEPRPSAPPRS